MRVPGKAAGSLLFLAVGLALLLLAGGVRAQDADPDYWQPSNLPEMGLATYYAPGLMNYVHDYRVQRGQLPECPDCVGSVALLRAGDIGRKVWLQPPGGELAGPFLVVDCARTEDVQPLVDRNWVVDVSYELGQTWGLAGPLDGVIVWADPSEGNAPRPAAQPTLFYIDPRDVIISLPTATPAAPQGGPLPTRVPMPRGNARVATATPQVMAAAAPTRGPAPLTPIITTPTPIGGAPPVPSPNVPAPAPVQAAQAGPPAIGTEHSAGPLRVSFARPGASLLAAEQPTPLPRLLAVPLATPGRAKQRLFPTPRPTSAVTARSTPAPAEKQAGPGSLLQRMWEALRGMFTTGEGGGHR